MPERDLKLRELRQRVRLFSVWEEPGRGKGNHTMFKRKIGDSVFSFPIGTNREPIKKWYIKDLRKKFCLTPEHGVSDFDFYDA